MPRFNLPVLGLEISFNTDADSERVRAAKELVEQRYKSLTKGGSNISKEKLLTCLVLSLADDYLEENRKLERQEKKINELLNKSPSSLLDFSGD